MPCDYARPTYAPSTPTPSLEPNSVPRLGAIGDIQRITNRALTGNLQPRELVTLRTSIDAIPDLIKSASILSDAPAIPDLSDVSTLLASAIVDEPPAVIGRGQTIRPGFSAEMDESQRRAREAREWIANLERIERDRTGIKSLKVGYNKVFGYYLEITTAALGHGRTGSRRCAAGRLHPQAEPDQRHPLLHTAAQGVRNDRAQC